MKSVVRYLESFGASPSSAALHYFEHCLRLETDCWDVNRAIHSGNVDFVLLDVRSPGDFKERHIPCAVNLPHKLICEQSLEAYPKDTLFIVYCAGPHCNGADKAGYQLAKLNRQVKKMIGGVTGWEHEGFTFVVGV